MTNYTLRDNIEPKYQPSMWYAAAGAVVAVAIMGVGLYKTDWSNHKEGPLAYLSKPNVHHGTKKHQARHQKEGLEACIGCHK